jgi:hypothetical protein
MQLDSRLEKYIPLQLEPVAIRLTAHIRLQRQIGRYGPILLQKSVEGLEGQ